MRRISLSLLLAFFVRSGFAQQYNLLGSWKIGAEQCDPTFTFLLDNRFYFTDGFIYLTGSYRILQHDLTEKSYEIELRSISIDGNQDCKGNKVDAKALFEESQGRTAVISIKRLNDNSGTWTQVGRQLPLRRVN